jgi:hypothetical protein
MYYLILSIWSILIVLLKSSKILTEYDNLSIRFSRREVNIQKSWIKLKSLFPEIENFFFVSFFYSILSRLYKLFEKQR